MAAKSFYLPRTLEEATELLANHGAELTVMGGGTIVMGQVNDGIIFPRDVMSLARAGLDAIEVEGNRAQVGAGATIAAVARHGDLGIVSEAATQIGGPAVRNLATVGGNLMAPGAYADLAVPLLALDAVIELAAVDLRRHVALDAFLLTRDVPNAAARMLITSVSFEVRASSVAYLRLGRRQANTPTVVSVAVRLRTNAVGVCTEARIAVAAGGPRPCRLIEAETELMGTTLDGDALDRGAETAVANCVTVTDSLATAWYRQRMVGVFVRRALVKALTED